MSTRLAGAFVRTHPVLTYFILTFAISWGGVLLVVGPGGFPGTPETFERLLPAAVLAMLVGPPLAGILLTGLVHGRAGLSDYRSRLLRWRVGARWYAVALLVAPLLMLMVLAVLSLFSPLFVPALLVSGDRPSLLLAGVLIALGAGIFEELGWTGFAIPELRRRYGVLATGLVVGLMWAAWHFLVAFWASGVSAGTLNLASYMLDPLLFLVGFRVLMVWVYDRTGSLPVAMLMHGSLTASSRILGAPALTGGTLLAFDLAWAGVIGIVAWAVIVTRPVVMTRIRAFIQRHPASTYFALTFAISWGGILLLAMVFGVSILTGPGGVPGAEEGGNALYPLVLLMWFAGPSVSSLLLTGLGYGRAGLRELLGRFLTWRVGVRWYAVAILPAPFVVGVVLLSLSLVAPEFLPGILATGDKAALLVFGVAWALVGGGLLEELGWTGFAVPRLRLRHGAVPTALIVGVAWGALHFILVFWGAGQMSGDRALATFLLGILAFYLGALPAYRVLMVWVYDRTGSLLVAMLMHASLSASMLILQPGATGVLFLSWNVALAATLWVMVAAVAVARRGRLARSPLPGRPLPTAAR
jgi:uncharacterized protein